MDCGPLSVPMNGSSSGDSTVFPNSVLFNCDPGFLLNGSSSRRCQANGTWSGLSVTCVGRLKKCVLTAHILISFIIALIIYFSANITSPLLSIAYVGLPGANRAIVLV